MSNETDFFNPTGSETERFEGENRQSVQQPTTKVDTDSDFFSGSSNEDLKTWMQQQASTPKQQYNHEEQPEETQNPASESASAAPGNEKPLKVSRQSEAAAKMVAKTIDFGWSSGAQFLTESESRKKWAAEDEDMDELVEAWALYIESQGAQIPPWLGLVLLNLIIYIFRVPEIIKARKEMLARKQQEKQAEEEKLARKRAAILAEEKKTQTDQPPSGSSEGEAGQRVFTSKDNQPITHCIQCGKELSPKQIERGGSFCSSSHANVYRAQKEKDRQKTIILNQQPT